jgi:hypothetical protein
MYDPKTVAHEFWRFTIWHNDPVTDGSDDSCGYCTPKLTELQKKQLYGLIWSEAHDPYFLRCAERKWTGTATEAETLYRGLILQVAHSLRINMTFDEAAKMASRYINFPDCTCRANVFCYLVGYHTNSSIDTEYWRKECATGLIYGVAKSLLKDRRPWYKHPKWHFWHWSIQFN